MGFEASTFLREFILPLVTGGELHVGAPLDAEDLEELCAELVIETEESMAVFGARQRLAGALWLYPVDTPLDRSALSLAAALHNVLFFSHPRIDKWTVRAGALDKVKLFTERCLASPPPRSAAEVIARHTLLRAVPRLLRDDVLIKFWVGSRDFIGMTPPTRLLRWKELRRVREDRQRVNWMETDLTIDQVDLLTLLMRQSPLTDLLSPTRAIPRFSWSPVAPYLRDRGICRLICHMYLEMGLDQVGPALARAFWELVDEPLEPGDRLLALGIVASLAAFLFASLELSPGDADRAGFSPQDTGDDLSYVLTAATDCGLLSLERRMGDDALAAEVQDRIQAARQLHGEGGQVLTARLHAALAA